LPQQHEPALAQSLATIAGDGVDEIRASTRETAHECAGVDVDAGIRFFHAERDGGFAGSALSHHFERTVADAAAGRQRMRRELQ
jgi:hypothetical protein